MQRPDGKGLPKLAFLGLSKPQRVPVQTPEGNASPVQGDTTRLRSSSQTPEQPRRVSFGEDSSMDYTRSELVRRFRPDLLAAASLTPLPDATTPAAEADTPRTPATAAAKEAAQRLQLDAVANPIMSAAQQETAFVAWLNTILAPGFRQSGAALRRLEARILVSLRQACADADLTGAVDSVLQRLDAGSLRFVGGEVGRAN
jgi:hypothetical protein